MSLDPEYLDAIKKSEGYSPDASWDYKQYSSGYGTKAQPGDESLTADQRQAIYEQRFQKEIADASAHVDSVNPNLPPGVKAALTSLTYNAGPGWSQSGLGDLIRAGDLEGAKARFLQYNKAGGEVNPGLVKRRGMESAWFDNPPAAIPQTAQATLASPAIGQPVRQAQASQPAPTTDQMAALQAPKPTPSLMGQLPAEQIGQPPPIFFAPRKPIDLSHLQAALQASGNRGFFLNRG